MLNRLLLNETFLILCQGYCWMINLLPWSSFSASNREWTLIPTHIMSAVLVLLCQVKTWIQTKNLSISYMYMYVNFFFKYFKKNWPSKHQQPSKVNDWYYYISISMVLPFVTCKSGFHILEVLLLSKENDQCKLNFCTCIPFVQSNFITHHLKKLSDWDIWLFWP